MVGKDSRKKDLIKNIENVFKTVQNDHNIPPADFPDPEVFAEKLKKHDFTKFPNYDKSIVEKIDKMLGEDFPKLMKLIPADETEKEMKGQGNIRGGVFNKVHMPGGKGFMAGVGEKIWIVSRNKTKYDEIFSTLEQHNGKITGKILILLQQ